MSMLGTLISCAQLARLEQASQACDTGPAANPKLPLRHFATFQETSSCPSPAARRTQAPHWSFCSVTVVAAAMLRSRK